MFLRARQEQNQRPLATARSVLLVEGDVSFENVQLDGALSIKAENGSKILLKNLSVKNKSWEWHPKSNAKEEITRLCGSEIKKKETAVVVSSKGEEDLVIDGDLSKLELVKKKALIIIIRALRVSTSRQNRIIDR